jgi:type VI secretion system protein ImpG
MADLYRLFRQEMRALQDEGSTFAKDFPEAARFLDPDLLEDRDPYVERLTEGVAFLTSRIRELSSSHQDGLTQHLLDVVAPELEAPLPSLAVVEFAPRSDTAAVSVLGKDATLRAGCRDGGRDIRFSLTNSVAIDRIQVGSARFDDHDGKNGELEIELERRFASSPGAWPATIEVFLLADPPVVWALRYALLRRLVSLEISVDGSVCPSPGVEIRRVAMPAYVSGDESPSPLENMRDFLCADERFRFFGIVGLDGLPRGSQTVRLRMRFQGSLPRGFSRAVEAKVFRLHAGIAVNRVVEICQALAWDHTTDTMALRPVGGAGMDVLDVVSVEGLTTGRPTRRIGFRKFSSYRSSGDGGHFQLIHRIGKDGARISEIAVGSGYRQEVLECQYLSVQAICSDGNRPHEAVQPDDFHALETEDMPRVTLIGLTRPTPSHRPASSVDPKSRLLAYAAGHFEGWMDAARLKDGLRQVMWEPSESKRTLIEAIQEVSLENDHVISNGVGWRRFVATIRLRDTTCAPETWDRLGILDAFGEGLYRFVMNETPIGARSKLRLVVEPAGSILEWEN